MNFLVFLDGQAGELEKILSGTKRMLVKEFDPALTACQSVNPGDSLYFLRSKDECAMRVLATVVRALFFTDRPDEDLSQILKEKQAMLQLTEDQYTYWSEKQHVLLVEIKYAHKIDMIHVASYKLSDRSDWIAFGEFSEIT